MTLAARPAAHTRYYPSSYSSDAVSSESETISRRMADDGTSGSAKCGSLQSTLFQQVVGARITANSRDWQDDNGAPISDPTVAAAIKLLYALPTNLAAPQVTPEVTGEIAFEWYRDVRHLAVISVQDDYIRWAALLGTDRRVSGAERFSGSIPGGALEAVLAAIG